MSKVLNNRESFQSGTLQDYAMPRDFRLVENPDEQLACAVRHVMVSEDVDVENPENSVVSVRRTEVSSPVAVTNERYIVVFNRTRTAAVFLNLFMSMLFAVIMCVLPLVIYAVITKTRMLFGVMFALFWGISSLMFIMLSAIIPLPASIIDYMF